MELAVFFYSPAGKFWGICSKTCTIQWVHPGSGEGKEGWYLFELDLPHVSVYKTDATWALTLRPASGGRDETKLHYCKYNIFTTGPCDYQSNTVQYFIIHTPYSKIDSARRSVIINCNGHPRGTPVQPSPKDARCKLPRRFMIHVASSAYPYWQQHVHVHLFLARLLLLPILSALLFFFRPCRL